MCNSLLKAKACNIDPFPKVFLILSRVKTSENMTLTKTQKPFCLIAIANNIAEAAAKVRKEEKVRNLTKKLSLLTTTHLMTSRYKCMHRSKLRGK